MSKRETDISQIRKYLKGELDAKAMHQLEKRAQDDPFLMDALDGYEHSGRKQDAQLAQLAERLQQRTARKEKRIISWQFMAIAASVLVILTAGGLWWYDQQPVRRANVAAVVIKPNVQPSVVVPPRAAYGKRNEIAALKSPHNLLRSQKFTTIIKKNGAVAKNQTASVNVVEPVQAQDSMPLNELIVTQYKSRNNNKAASVSGSPLKFKATSKTISGTVVGENDGSPIVGAIVKVAGSSTQAFTDANGHFILPIDSDNVKLNIGYIGYESQRVSIQRNEDLRIALQPKVNGLGQINISGDKAVLKKNSKTDTGNHLISKVNGLAVKSNSRFNSDYTVINGNLIKGVVIGKDDRLPLPGATVKIAGTNIAAITDAKGRFALPFDSTRKATLVVGYLGYNAARVSTSSRDSLKTIVLQPNNSSLNEVVVTGYTSKNADDAAVIDAHPQEGWTSFKKYVKESAHSPDGKTGVVILSFTVAGNGDIRDIKVVKSLSIPANQKAIAIINNGPGWTGNATGKPEKVRVRIKFR